MLALLLIIWRKAFNDPDSDRSVELEIVKEIYDEIFKKSMKAGIFTFV
jgi:hypothetical protein